MIAVERMFPSFFSPHQIAAKVWGSPDSTSVIPVIGLHGWLDNAATWDLLVPKLFSNNTLLSRLCFVSIDFRGHGLSSPQPQGANYNFLDHVPEIISVADSLNWQSFHLVGHSMGSGVSTILAATYPERVRTITLVDGFGPWIWPSDQSVAKDFRKYYDTSKLLMNKKPNVFKTKEEAMAKISNNNPSLAPHSIASLVSRGVKQTEEGFEFRHDIRHRIPSPIRLYESQIQNMFESITCPVLAVIAEDGDTLTKSYIPIRRPLLKDSSVIFVPGGHHVHLDNADIVAPSIIEFLTQRDCIPPESCKL